ncbi:MAG TPA: AMP-binding protein [Bryobacteraceae bacterium]|nr:AMP-binding protein [Bryobacteraceae bacterium]
MPRRTLLDFFESLAAETGEFLVYDDGYRSWSRTYRDVVYAARHFALRLRAHNIGKGEKIVFWSENRPEWIAALWGCLLEGVVAVPVDYHSSADFAARIAAIVQARAILTGDAASAAAGLFSSAAVWPFRQFDWPARAPGDSPGPSLSPDDLAEIVFTSGATAEPKGVLITHRNLLSNIVPVENEVKKYRKWGTPFYPIRFLNLLPLSHLFGQSLATFIPPMIGGAVVFQRSYHPAEIMRQIHRRRVSVLVSVPKILEVLRDYVRQAFPETAQASAGGHWLGKWWRYRRVHRAFGWKFWAFIAGAAPLDPAVEEFWSRLGFLVIQGYGLTETAPIVALNHPFHARKGTVGAPIGGVEVRLAEDGEILVRGGNVSQGYYGQPAAIADGGWLHTGDIGEQDRQGRLIIRGRKKDMIVLPDGRKVFPEDVEAVLRSIAGVRDCAVVGPDRVHAVLALEPNADAEDIVARANRRLEEHQKIREVSCWPSGEDLPRTAGTAKLKRGEILQRIAQGLPPSHAAPRGGLIELLQRYAPGRAITPETALDQLGLSSLDRIQLLMEMEQAEMPIDEASFTAAKTVGDLARPALPSARQPEAEPFEFPQWSLAWPARWLRRAAQPLLLLPLARIWMRLAVAGLENLRPLEPPVIFAPNHQSHLDVPAILCALPARWRYRIAPAMSKEFFDAHFHPARFGLYRRFLSGLQYYLAALCFNAFPLPQRGIGARRALRYMGELMAQGWCVVIFPEGDRTRAGEIRPFQPGAAMLASHARVPVVPVRIEGLDRVLHRDAHWPTRGPVKISFGPALTLEGSDYAAQARDIHDAVKRAGAR